MRKRTTIDIDVLGASRTQSTKRAEPRTRLDAPARQVSRSPSDPSGSTLCGHNLQEPLIERLLLCQKRRKAWFTHDLVVDALSRRVGIYDHEMSLTTLIPTLLRLRDLVGSAPDQWTEKDLASFVRDSVREDEDLDFKRDLYPNSDKGKRELAADLASFANHRGGVIVIGIEDQDDAACALSPVEIVNGEEARVRQTAAGNIFPYLPIEIHAIACDSCPAKGFLVLVVPSSPLRPHAVRKGIDLRYPRRDGTTTRWLSEAEIADQYRSRFRAIADQTTKLSSVVEQGMAAMKLNPDAAHLAVGLVPNSPGSMELGFDRIREIEKWTVEDCPAYWRGFFKDHPNGRSGIRKVRLGNLAKRELPGENYAELHTDGSGFGCDLVGRCDPRTAEELSPPCLIHGAWLLWSTAQSLRLLGRHAAENTGSWGDAIVEMRLLGGNLFLTRPDPRGIRSESWNAIPINGPVISSHTVSIQTLIGSDQDLLATARLVATDLFNGFGAAEVREVDRDGRIRLNYVVDQSAIQRMANQAGVDISHERL